jgi:hypothetical protein
MPPFPCPYGCGKVIPDFPEQCPQCNKELEYRCPDLTCRAKMNRPGGHQCTGIPSHNVNPSPNGEVVCHCHCMRCGANVASRIVVCPSCGQNFDFSCPICGTHVSPMDLVCPLGHQLRCLCPQLP